MVEALLFPAGNMHTRYSYNKKSQASAQYAGNKDKDDRCVSCERKSRRVHGQSWKRGLSFLYQKPLPGPLPRFVFNLWAYTGIAVLGFEALWWGAQVE